MTQVFGDARIGRRMEIDVGGGRWMKVVKVGPCQAKRERDGTVLGISFWTEVRDVVENVPPQGKPLIDLL